jgi:hypothetical protein
MKYINEKAPSVKSKVKDINKKIGKLVSKKEDAISKAKEMADSEEPSGKMQASLAKIQLRQSESEAEKLMLQKQAEILKAKIDTAKKKEKTTKDIDIEEMENRPITILEGVMSDIHQMINNHKNFDSFQKEFFKEYGHKKVMKKTPEFLEWLEALYNDSQFAVAEADAKPGPDPYMRGLDDDDEEKKEDKMKKQAEMDDDDPDAYKELPGDKEAKAKGEVKTSKHVKKYHELYGDKKDESVINEEKAEGDRGKIADAKIETALKTKAEETGVPIGLIRIIMRRGMAAWKTGHRPGASEQQWGYARVNAFLTKGDGTWGGADKDVAKEVRDGGHDKGLKEGVESEIGLSDKLGKFKHSKPSKESESPNNITCGNCSWTWLKQDGGDDMYTCHKCGTDNAPSLGESMINEEDTYNDYPAAAKKNAKKALDWRDEHGRDEVDAGTAVGWTRANQLAKGEKISADTVKRMASFNRHRKNSSIKAELKGTPWKDKGYVSWLIWGGDEGVDWAMKKSKEIDNMKESKQMRYIKPLTEGIYAKQSKIQPGEYIQTQYGYFYKRVEGQVGGQDAYVEIKKGKEGKKKTSIHDTVDFNIVDKSIALDESQVTEAEAYVTDKFKVGDKIKTGFGEWEIIETDYAPKKSFMAPFIFKGDDMKRVNIPNPPKTNKNAVGYKVTDGDKYPIIGFLYQYKDITKLATVGVDESVVNEKDKHASTDFSKPGNDGDIYFSKREGDAVGIRLEDKLQMIYVFQEEPKLGRIQKTDKRWKNMGPASEELLIDLRGRTEGKILFDFVSTLEESIVTEGMSKSAIKKAIKVIDQQIEDEEGGNGEPLDNETLQALEQERERLLGMNEGKFSPMGYAKRVVDGSIKIKDAMKEAGISLGNIAKLIKKIDKSFNVDAAFLEKNVMQDDPEKFVESKKLKYVKVLNEGVDGYTYNKWIKENGKIKYPKWIEEQRKEIIKQGLMQPVYDSESQNMIIWINSFGKKFFPINADSKKREKEFGKNGSEFINRFYNDLTGYSAFFWQAATICLEIIRHIEDMQVNGESIEPSYYLAKEYFNNHGLDTKRSRIFNSTTEKLAVWMKDNNIETL